MDIDPNVLTVILGLVVNGLTSLIATSSSKAKELIIGKEFLDTWELEKTALSPMVHQAIADIAQYGTWKVPVQDEVVSLFLQTPEVEDIVRQVYAVKFQEHYEQEDNLTKLYKIFFISLTQFISNYLDSPSNPEYEQYMQLTQLGMQSLFDEHIANEDQQFTNASKQLFDTLVQGCNIVLDNAIDRNILSAHEAKSSFRHNLLSSELKTIQKKLDFLIAQQQIDINAINDFEKDYCRQVGAKYGRIAPPNLDAEHKLPIDDLYVYPSFVAVSSKKGEKPETIKRDEFFARVHRAVLLGNPGAGKSTLTQKLCYDLTQHYDQRLFAGHDNLTPILVILREYGNEKKEYKSSIHDFIESEVKAKYQLPEPPEEAFEYLLLNGRSIVIFDGLDELLDTSYRQEIRDDVQLFCNLYPSVPVLVTSREVGYEQAPLDDKQFEVFHLDAFDDEQIEEYVNKWFNAADAHDLTESQRQARIKAFLDDSQIVPDLRSNPLMLGLLCSIYRQENYIPRYRPDVYEKCAIMLFERWDRNRKIYIPPIPEEHVRPLMEYLANWIYDDDQLRAGVTEEELALKATAYLQEWLYESQPKAEQAARDFIDFCTGRAWVFTDTGTQRDGEKLYQFSHATFLEYFTASHLVRTCRTPSELLAVLVPKITKKEWDVVAQIAFQIQSKRSQGAADELLLALIDESQKRKDYEKWNLLYFAVRCLQFIVPRPNVRRCIAEASIKLCLVWGREQVEQNISREDSFESLVLENPANLLDALFFSTVENKVTIAETLEMLTIEIINSDQLIEKQLVLEIIFGFTFPLLFEANNELLEFWENSTGHVRGICFSKIEELGPISLLFCKEAYAEGEVSLSQIIKWYGAKGVYLYYPFILFPDGSASSISVRAIFPLLEGSPDERLVEKSLKFLKEVGQILLTHETPWINKDDLKDLNFYERSFDNYQKLLNVDADALFGVFVVLAVQLEIENTRERKSGNSRRYNTSKMPELLHKASLMRTGLMPTDNVKDEISKYNIKPEQKEFILRWVRKEINLVAPEAVQKSDQEW